MRRTTPNKPPETYPNKPPETYGSQSEAAAGQVLAYVLYGFIGANAVMLLAVAQLASSRQHRRQHHVPPPDYLMGVFYLIGALCLVGSVLWVRSRASAKLQLPQKEFQRQIIIGLGLANLSEYLGVFWLALGGAFLSALPFFAGPALATLLFLLPLVRKRNASRN